MIRRPDRATIEGARSRLQDARFLFTDERYGAAMNRIYYAMVEAVTAVLFTIGVTSQSHGRLWSALNNYFVRTKQLDADIAKGFQYAYRLRFEADYNYRPPDAPIVEEYLGRAEALIDWAEAYIG